MAESVRQNLIVRLILYTLKILQLDLKLEREKNT